MEVAAVRAQGIADWRPVLADGAGVIADTAGVDAGRIEAVAD
jgi:hypothetical protein